MYRWFQRQSAYTQFIILLGVSLLLFACFFSFWRVRTLEYYEQRNEEYLDDFESQLQLSIQSNYSIISRIIRLVSYDENLQDYLLSENPAERFTLFQSMRRRLSDVANLKSQILDMVVVDSRGNRINLSDVVYPLPQMDLSDNKLHFSPLQKNRVSSGDASYIVLGKTINSIDSHNQTNQRIGWLFLILSPEALTGGDSPTASTSGTHIYLVDQEERMLWSNDASCTQESCADSLAHPEAYASFRELALSTVPYRLILCQTQPIRLIRNIEWPTVFLIAVTVFGAFLMLIWGLFARNVVRPCKELADFNKEVSQGGLSSLSTEISLSGFKEARLMGETTSQMLKQIRTLTGELVTANQDLYENRLLKRQTELMYLRSQINPHFLYNTLETMVGIAYSEHQPQLARIARSLSLIFKYSIKGEDLVPLSDELMIAKNYLKIQHYRFQHRFDISYDIPDACLSYIVPKMVLQPLIENSIVHGIERQQERFCHLQLSAGEKDGLLSLTVEDDGIGIEQDRLKEILDRLSLAPVSEEDEKNGHIGLLNVNSRIRLRYGMEYGVRIESEPGARTRVSLVLPAREKI